MSRIVWIDIAKTICIILVVIGHYIPDIHPVWYGEMRRIIYTFHMPLFMFASGFVYIAAKRKVTYRDFLWGKVKRLMIPYFTVSIIVITLKLLSQGAAYVENPVTPFSYFKILYLPEAGYFLWFIWALWWMFVVIPVFSAPKARLALFIVSLFLPLTSSYLPEMFCLKQFANMLQFFMAGVVVYEWRQYLKWCANVPILVVGLAFCMIEAMPYIGGGGNSLLIASVGIAFTLKISYEIEKYSRLSSWKVLALKVSSASYIIYLLHTTFEGFTKALIFKLPYFQTYPNEIIFCIGAIIVVSSGLVFPLLLHKYVLTRHRSTRLLFGLK